MRSLGVALVAASLGACTLLPPPEGIQVTIPAGPDVHALPVTVVDSSGIVRDAMPAILVGVVDGTTVEAVAGRHDAVVVSWIGGDCDDHAIISIEPTGDRYRASVTSQSSAMSCSAAGVLRGVRLSLTKPVGLAFDSS